MIRNNISKNITYSQAIYSGAAIKNKIGNIPSERNLINMEILAEMVYEPIYTYFGGSIYITSFYRSPEVNKKLKGAKNSQHQAINGAALDFVSIDPKISNKDIFHWIIDNLEFDQLISEYADAEGNPKWIHVSFNKDKNRNQVIYIS